MKTKKLFPELTPLVGAPIINAKKDAAPARFSLSRAFWDTLDSDSQVKAEFDRLVETRARAIIDGEASPQRDAIFASAKKQGLEQGLSEGREQAAKINNDLQSIVKQIASEKVTLVRAHEETWCSAIAHLARRFLIPLTPERLKDLKAWIEESIGDLSKQAKVRVALAPAVLDRVKTASLDVTQWDWVADEALAETDFRVELEGGGLLFSPKAECEKLDAKLQEVLGV